MWRTALLFFLAPQWCLPSTKPGVSTVLPALHATPSWLSSKCCAGLKDKSIRLLNPRRSDLKTASFIFLLLCTFRHLSLLGFCLSSTNLHLFQQLYFYHCRLSLYLFLSLLPPLPTPTTSVVFFPFYFVSPPVYRLLPCFLPRSVRDKFVEVDLKPVCKHCYERLPDDMRRRLAKRERDSKEKKKKPLIPMCLWCSLSICPLPLLSLWSVSFSFAFFAFSFSCLFYSLFLLLFK